jgi:undecaprenyl-diphosphatase
MTAFHAFALAVLQGITELFPISSLGHTVILPALLGWRLDQAAPAFLPLIVVLHLGTAAALLVYFWRDWLFVLNGVFGRGDAGRTRDARRLLGLIVVATLPAVVIGFAFEKFLLGDRLRDRAPAAPAANRLGMLGWRGALAIGFWQCLAFFPGISRSGAAMVGGLVSGLHHTEAAHFSFLIATPIIAGAGVLEVPKLLRLPGAGLSGLALAAGLVAGLTAYASTVFLMRYFRRHDFEDALVPFAIYCWAAGGIAALALLVWR